ncbi:MAG: leucine-rich repeat domain-containing protein, partial [Ruminococcus sp.]|nr:leucine-rich repeat domain-containing protein [Ruminococcus sp.]
MCKRTKRLLCAAAALVLAVSGIQGGAAVLPLTGDIIASAEVTSGSCGESVNYELNGDVLTISGTGDMDDYSLGRSPFLFFSDDVTKVVVSSGVTSIGDSAFYGFSNLQSLTLASTITDIGNYAFYGCGLESVTVPGTVSTVGDRAFSDCFKLTSAKLSSGVTELGDEAFAGCLNLFDVEFADSVDYIGDGAFTDSSWLSRLSKNGLSVYNGFLLDGSGASGAVSVPSGVKSVCGSAFSGNSAITSVVLPSGVKSVGDYAFKNCTGLTSVTLNSDLTDLGIGAFTGCTSLKSADLPAGLSCVPYGAFSGCKSLSAVSLSNNMSDISGYAFYNCKGLKSIEFLEGLAAIADHAFEGCTNLAEISFPESVESIGTTAFESTKWFTEQKNASPLIIVNNIVVSGKRAKGLVAIPNGTKSISDRAFEGAAGITSVIIPESVTDIGSGAFLDCTSLTSVTVPSGVNSIGEAAFGFATDKTTGEPTAVKGFVVRYVKGTEGENYASVNNILGMNYNNDSNQAVIVKSAAENIKPSNMKVTIYNEKGETVKTVAPASDGTVNLSSLDEGKYDMVISCPDLAPLTLPYSAG